MSLPENEIIAFFLLLYIFVSDKCIYCFTVAFIVHVQIYVE